MREMLIRAFTHNKVFLVSHDVKVPDFKEQMKCRWRHWLRVLVTDGNNKLILWQMCSWGTINVVWILLKYVSVGPRKSLDQEIPVIVACTEKKKKKTNSVYYFPREDTCCRLNDFCLDSLTVDSFCFVMHMGKYSSRTSSDHPSNLLAFWRSIPHTDYRDFCKNIEHKGIWSFCSAYR